MKKITIIVLCLLLAVAAGFWFAKSRGTLSPTKVTNLSAVYPQLQAHFKNQGVDVEIGPAQNAYTQPSRMAALFQLKDAPDKKFFVILCHTPAEAKNYIDFLGNVPSKILHAMNDNLVIYMTDWNIEDPLSQKILNAFSIFKAESY